MFNFLLFNKLLPKTQSAPASPDVLGQKIKPHPDVKRVTHAPIIILMVLGIIIGGGVGFTAYSKAQSIQNTSQQDAKTTNPTADTPDWFAKHQQEGVIKPEIASENAGEPQETTPLATTDSGLVLSNPAPVQNTQPMAMTPYQEAQLQQWQQHEQAKQQLEEQRRATLQNALSANTTVFSNPTTLQASVKQQGGLPSDPNLDLTLGKASPEPANYLLHTRTPALSPFEVKAGTVIPSVMLGGVNSDLPGQIHAQVAQNVYDTATGQYLLIPQGTKLVGSYDHPVVSGQKRVLVIWNRLIYPDASSVTLEGMSGSDPSGYAGFSDKTNSHFWPTFRNALLLSAISAGVQLSQPRATNGNYSYSSNQIAAGALGQQMNQVGMNTINRNINQAPTLTIRPGYVFNVMVNKDVILPPWSTTGHS